MTLPNPLVSVILPTYNYGHFVGEAIASALSSDYPNFEVIVVNDGSTDALTRPTLDAIDDPRVKVYHIENGGVSAARNFAIYHSSGKYILPLDADNLLLPDYMPKAVAFLESNPDYDIVYADYQTFGKQNNHHVQGQFDLAKMIFSNTVDNCTVYRRSTFDKTPSGYAMHSNLNTHEDWMFFLNMLLVGARFKYIPEVLWKYRTEHEGKLITLGRDQTRIAKVYSAVYPLQMQLLDRAQKDNSIPHDVIVKIKGDIIHRLGYLTINHLNYFSGIDYLIQSSIVNPKMMPVNLKVIIAASYRKLTGRRL